MVSEACLRSTSLIHRWIWPSQSIVRCYVAFVYFCRPTSPYIRGAFWIWCLRHNTSCVFIYCRNFRVTEATKQRETGTLNDIGKGNFTVKTFGPPFCVFPPIIASANHSLKPKIPMVAVSRAIIQQLCLNNYIGKAKPLLTLLTIPMSV